MNEIERYYKLLGLELGASLEEINQAYKDLVFIWHPDRLPKDNQRLLEKATAKLQEINHAREQLRLVHEQPPKKSPSQRTPENGHARPTATKTAPPPPNHGHHPEGQRPFYRDLSGANLQGADLKEKDLSGRRLIAANLSHADLSDSFLHKINLEKANLFQANLFRANLLEANLRGANLQEANLIGADFSGADLREADLRGAKIGYGKRIMVKLTGALLSGAILPDGTIHA
jgi:curved DNA-binding protein CbpA